MTDPQTVVATPAPLTGSQRVALSRRRKREDIVFVGMEILPTERDALIRSGFLNKDGRNNKIAVRDALYAFFESRLDPKTTIPWLWAVPVLHHVCYSFVP
jgi:hypothetical protein